VAREGIQAIAGTSSPGARAPNALLEPTSCAAAGSERSDLLYEILRERHGRPALAPPECAASWCPDLKIRDTRPPSIRGRAILTAVSDRWAFQERVRRLPASGPPYLSSPGESFLPECLRQ